MTFTATAYTPMARNRSTPPAFEPTPASLALKMRRIELGKSQADVAFDSGLLTQTTVSELERGKYGPEDLTAARLAALARGLNWTVSELEGATGLELGLTRATSTAEVKAHDVISAMAPHDDAGGRSRPAPTELAALRRYARLSQEELASRIAEITGDEIGQAAISYWELGKVDLKKVHPRKLRAYAQALDVTPAMLADAAGFQEEELFPEAAAPWADDRDPPGFPAAPFEDDDEVYMPEALLEAIQRFGDDPEYAGLKDPETQRELALARGFRGGPQTPGEWLAFYIGNRRWLDKKDN